MKIFQFALLFDLFLSAAQQIKKQRLFDMSNDKIASLICLFFLLLCQEPSNKRVRPLGRVTSLASLISPVKNGAVRRFGQTIQVSCCDIPQKGNSQGKGHTFAVLHVAPHLASHCNLTDIWDFLFPFCRPRSGAMASCRACPRSLASRRQPQHRRKGGTARCGQKR